MQVPRQGVGLCVGDTHPLRRHLWWIASLTLVLVGGAVALTAQAVPEDFGWIAYAPAGAEPTWSLGSSTGASVVALSRGQLAGLALAALGLVALAAGTGFRLGSQRPGPREP